MLGFQSKSWWITNRQSRCRSTPSANTLDAIKTSGKKGELKAAKQAEFNGIEGKGLIYVNGDLKIKKSSWVGLIYTEGTCEIGSDTWILGAVLARGSDTHRDTGTDTGSFTGTDTSSGTFKDTGNVTAIIMKKDS